MEQIICIDNIGVSELTLYKLYDVVEYVNYNHLSAIIIKNDNKTVGIYAKERFVNLQEWRNRQIDDTLKKL